MLDGGTLSYYDSQEDALKGCKGSIKISVCEIQGKKNQLRKPNSYIACCYSVAYVAQMHSLVVVHNTSCRAYIRTTAIVNVHTKDRQLLIRFVCPPSSLVVHPSDFTRLDLIIPGEQYFYLRALNAAERQKWLVALGTAKACLTDNRTKREKGESHIKGIVHCKIKLLHHVITSL